MLECGTSVTTYIGSCNYQDNICCIQVIGVSGQADQSKNSFEHALVDFLLLLYIFVFILFLSLSLSTSYSEFVCLSVICCSVSVCACLSPSL